MIARERMQELTNGEKKKWQESNKIRVDMRWHVKTCTGQLHAMMMIMLIMMLMIITIDLKFKVTKLL